jgi:hypothetical protein
MEMEKKGMIKKMLEQGKTISEILKEHPDLIDAVDEVWEELKKHSLAASTTPLIKKQVSHHIRARGKKTKK